MGRLRFHFEAEPFLFFRHSENIGELAVQRLKDAAQVIAVQAVNLVFVVAVNNMILNTSTFCEIISADTVGV